MSYFVVIQTGTVVYGSGTTAEEAMLDAIEWLDRIDTIEELESEIDGHNGIDGLELRSCTEALYNYVQEYGGSVVWCENEYGDLCLESEVESDDDSKD